MHVLDASRVVGVVSDLLDGDRRQRLDVDNRELQEPPAGAARRPHAQAAAPARRREGELRARVLRRAPEAAVHRDAQRRARPRDAPPLHRLAVLLLRLGAEGQVPGDPRAAGGAVALRRRDEAPRRDPCRQAAPGPRCVRLLARGRRRGRHRARRHALRHAAPAVGVRRLAAEPLARRLRRPGRRPHRRLRRRRSRRRRAGRALRGRARRLQRDHRQGAGRPAGRGVRGAAARAGPPRVVRARPGALERRADLGALPGHPARLRLPGLPGPLGEAQALRPARRRRRPASRSPRASP